MAASAGPSARPAFAHIYLVVMENHEYDTIVGSADAPYLNGLIARYGLATDLHAVAHPSEPNYLALVSGSTQGVHDDGVYNLDAPSLFDQIEAAGKTWHVYAQGYPGSCSGTDFTGDVVDGPGVAGQYARKHNPAISFNSISRNPGRCARITDLAGFDPAAADFELIVPNQNNDMHSASVATGDQFLRSFLPSILDSPAFAADSLLIVTWDEGGSDAGGGGHIATILATPKMAPGTRFDGAATHYSVLRTIEDAWGMPPLGAAADATPIPVKP
jgi:acid phosphatase